MSDNTFFGPGLPIDRFGISGRDAAAIDMALTVGGDTWGEHLAWAIEEIDNDARWAGGGDDVHPGALGFHRRVERLMDAEGITYPAAVERLIAQGAGY